MNRTQRSPDSLLSIEEQNQILKNLLSDPDDPISLRLLNLNEEREAAKRNITSSETDPNETEE